MLKNQYNKRSNNVNIMSLACCLRSMNRFFLLLFWYFVVFFCFGSERGWEGETEKKYDTQRIYWSRHWFTQTHWFTHVHVQHTVGLNADIRRRRQWMVAEERRDTRHSWSYLISRCVPTWSPIAVCTSNCDLIVVVSNSKCHATLFRSSHRTPNNIFPVEFLFKLLYKKNIA